MGFCSEWTHLQLYKFGLIDNINWVSLFKMKYHSMYFTINFEISVPI